MNATDAILLAGAVGAAIEAARRWVYKPIAAVIRKTDTFLDDWNGIPSRPGVPARLGVMTRLAVLEENGAHTRADLARVVHEVTPNSGGSLKDIASSTRDELRAHIEDACKKEERLWKAIGERPAPKPRIPKPRKEQP